MTFYNLFDLPVKIQNKIMPVTDVGCWLWIGVIGNHGYGVISPNHTKKFLAHRVIFKTLAGKISDGLYIDHLCRVRSCVNPAHMEPVTNGENVLRGMGLAAMNARKTNCRRGHDLAGDNLILTKGGSRECRTCRNKSSMAKYFADHEANKAKKRDEYRRNKKALIYYHANKAAIRAEKKLKTTQTSEKPFPALKS